MNKVIERADLPVVAINLLTKDRTELAVRTIHQAIRHLKYDGELKWFVSDNGSTQEHLIRLEKEIPSNCRIALMTYPGPIGECWNAGLKTIFRATDYYIRLEDDMCLKADLDITRYVKIMMTFPGIGMVRLGQMCVDLGFDSQKFKIYTHIGFEEDIFLRVNKNYNYCFSGHPAIISNLFHERYGFYSENNISPGELEIEMDRSVRREFGPGIYFPWDLGRFGTWGAWDHIGRQKAE